MFFKHDLCSTNTVLYINKGKPTFYNSVMSLDDVTMMFTSLNVNNNHL